MKISVFLDLVSIVASKQSAPEGQKAIIENKLSEWLGRKWARGEWFCNFSETLQRGEAGGTYRFPAAPPAEPADELELADYRH